MWLFSASLFSSIVSPFFKSVCILVPTLDSNRDADESTDESAEGTQYYSQLLVVPFHLDADCDVVLRL